MNGKKARIMRKFFAAKYFQKISFKISAAKKSPQQNVAEKFIRLKNFNRRAIHARRLTERNAFGEHEKILRKNVRQITGRDDAKKSWARFTGLSEAAQTRL